MAIKQDILKVLEENRGEYFSGEELASKLSVTRQAIWKGIKALEEEGHHIKATTNKGYYLEQTSDLLTSVGILQGLVSCNKNFEVIVEKTVESTNLMAKKLVGEGKKGNFIIVANEQTAGLGRQGKSFHSPKNGIYMSIVLDMQEKITDAQLITSKTAVAVVEAIESLEGLNPQIKWVNDILLTGKKICGILTEGIFDFEEGKLKKVIIGIGLNVNQDIKNYPKDLQNKAGGFKLNENRNQLVSKIALNVVNNLMEDDEKVMARYKKYSMILGKNIIFEPESQNLKGVVIDINDLGHLIVKLENGELMNISSGFVDIEGLYK